MICPLNCFGLLLTVSFLLAPSVKAGPICGPNDYLIIRHKDSGSSNLACVNSASGIADAVPITGRINWASLQGYVTDGNLCGISAECRNQVGEWGECIKEPGQDEGLCFFAPTPQAKTLGNALLPGGPYLEKVSVYVLDTTEINPTIEVVSSSTASSSLSSSSLSLLSSSPLLSSLSLSLPSVEQSPLLQTPLIPTVRKLSNGN